jgi:hypothetical protein
MKDTSNSDSSPMQSGLRKGSHDLSKALPMLFIGLAIILRLVQYLYNRSLWVDESFLALNIINRSFKTLLQPLDFNQGAQVGFLMIEKAAVELLGQSEYVLRLFPFICGILSIFLFYRLAKHCLQGKAVLIALGLFAICEPLIYYSSEVKQYSCDVVVTLLLFVVVDYVRPNKPTVANILLLGLAGAVAVWLSHPAIFVLTGIAVYLMLSALGRGDFQRIKSYLPAFILWLFSFAGLYLVSLRHLVGNHDLQDFFQGSFMPLLPRSVGDLRWFVTHFFEIFNHAGGLPLTGLAALAFIVGGLSLWKEKKDELLMLTAPIVIALIASGFHKYPFVGRLILFIAPVLLIIVAAGVEFIRSSTRAANRIIGITLMVLLFLNPAMTAGYQLLVEPKNREDIKSVLEYVTDHKQNGDKLYVYYASEGAFKYYQKKYTIEDGDYVIGVSARGKLSDYKNDLERLRGIERIWVIFSHINVDEKLFILYCLDGMGQRLDSINAKGAAAYLYRLAP